MKLIVTGSGGAVSTPRPCCNCRVCREARQKGIPYARTGCSLYISDAKILIDTPEDIGSALNYMDIDEIRYIFYSHTHPDHIMGIRLIEQLRMDWLGNSEGIKSKEPVYILGLPRVIQGLCELRIDRGAVVENFRDCGLVKTIETRRFDKDDLSVELIPANLSQNVTVFLIQQSSKKVIYAPCDVKPFPHNSRFQNADFLIIGDTIPDNILKNGFVLRKENPFRNILFLMDEIMELKEKYQIKNVIITHLEEVWGKSFDEYQELEKSFDGIQFAYDGMEITL